MSESCRVHFKESPEPAKIKGWVEKKNRSITWSEVTLCIPLPPGDSLQRQPRLEGNGFHGPLIPLELGAHGFCRGGRMELEPGGLDENPYSSSEHPLAPASSQPL